MLRPSAAVIPGPAVTTGVRQARPVTEHAGSAVQALVNRFQFDGVGERSRRTVFGELGPFHTEVSLRTNTTSRTVRGGWS